MNQSLESIVVGDDSGERLVLGYDYGTVVSIEYKTEIINNIVGEEQRNICWYEPLISYKIGQRQLTNNELEYLLTFFEARKGSKQSFSIRDWTDYFAIGNLLGIGDDYTRAYQIYKTYEIEEFKVNRLINRPINNTIKIYFNGIEFAGNYQLLDKLGIIVFDIAPALNTVIRVDFEFDVVVRLNNDIFSYSLQGYDRFSGEAIYNLSEIDLIEVRLNSSYLLNQNYNYFNELPIDNLAVPQMPISLIPNFLLVNLDLGIVYDTQTSLNSQTAIATNKGGWEKRESNWNNLIVKNDFAEKRLNRKELDYLIAFFRLSFGKAINFYFESNNARFDSDVLNLQFEAKDSQNIIVTLKGLPIKRFFTSIKYKILDLPILKDLDSDYTIYVIANPNKNWNYFNLSNSFFLNGEYNNIGEFGKHDRAIGVCQTVIQNANPYLFDYNSSLIVLIEANADSLISISFEETISGKNLALVGEELISFSTVEQISPNQYKLSNFARGCRGTDRATIGHSSNEQFILFGDYNTQKFQGTNQYVGITSFFKASIGQNTKGINASTFIYQAKSILNYPPNLNYKRLSNGDLEIFYEIRSRRYSNWGNLGNPDNITNIEISIIIDNLTRLYNLPYNANIANRQILTRSELSILFGFSVTINSQILVNF